MNLLRQSVFGVFHFTSCALCCLGIACAGCSRNDAGLEVDQQQFDFGKLSLSAAKNCEHHFMLSNKTNTTVRILDKSTTCGYTGATLPNNSIEPGASTDLTVKADWSRKVGPQQVSVVLKTDSAKTPVIRVIISGTVEVPVGAFPSQINFGLLRAGEIATRDLVISSTKGSVLITGVTVKSSNAKLQRLDQDDNVSNDAIAGPLGKYRITLKGPPSGNTEQSSIVFSTNVSELPELVVPISAEYIPTFRVEPTAMFFGNKSDLSSRLQTVTILCSSDKPEPTVAITGESGGTSDYSVLRIQRNEGPDQSALFIVTVARKLGGNQKTATLHVERNGQKADVPLRLFE